MKALHYIKENYLLLSILALAVFLRFYHADFQSIWIDEIHTMIESDPMLTWAKFHNIMMVREGMGHLYFLMLKYLYMIFGYTTLTARLFSGVIGVLSVYAIYLVGRAIYNKNVGLIAALLLTVNIFHITYSQEARPYALLMLFVTVAFYRLILFIRTPSLRNAIYFGIFAGLSVNAHFVGLIPVFSQFLLILFILIKTNRAEKTSFFKLSFISGVTAFLVMLPTYSLFIKMSGYHSGWLTLPGPDGFTDIFRLFLGNTELLYFIFTVIIIVYFVSLFRERENSFKLEDLKGNKLIFSGIILFCWMFLSIVLPIVKSYLSEPMILHRYFIGVLPALILILAIGIELVRNNISKVLLIATIVTFSLLDIFIVKDYYNTVMKSQYREITEIINNKNKDQRHKVVSSFGWLFSYFFNQDKNNPRTIESTLPNHIAYMRNGAIPVESFWFMDGNSRLYSLTPEDEQFLQQHFDLKENIEMFDTWARHYVSKNLPSANVDKMPMEEGKLNMSDFTPFTDDGQGHLAFFQNGESTSAPIKFIKGKYILQIKGNSIPEKPVNGQNAHIVVKIDGNTIAEYYLSPDKNNPEKLLEFDFLEDKMARLSIVFDNDIAIGTADRNAIIYSISLRKR